MARKYESIIVINPDLPEAKVKEEETRIVELLKANGATTTNVERWGKKAIAYRVQKHKQGHFLFVTFESEKENVTVPVLTAQLRLMENVIKFQTHHVGKKTRKFQGNPLRKPGDTSIDDFMDSDLDY